MGSEDRHLLKMLSLAGDSGWGVQNSASELTENYSDRHSNYLTYCILCWIE